LKKNRLPDEKNGTHGKGGPKGGVEESFGKTGGMGKEVGGNGLCNGKRVGKRKGGIGGKRATVENGGKKKQKMNALCRDTSQVWRRRNRGQLGGGTSRNVISSTQTQGKQRNRGVEKIQKSHQTF